MIRRLQRDAWHRNPGESYCPCTVETPYKYMALDNPCGTLGAMTRFEWDPIKDRENQRKHGVDFSLAQFAFADPQCVIAEDLSHGGSERRYF
jgi:Ribonuclease toxin, BrnT, of type II toxin-antitoxin system